MGILKGKASTIPGFSSVDFNVGKGVSIIHFFEALGVQYGLGSKINDLSQPTDKDIKFNVAPGKPHPSIDCSGMFRFLLFKCAGVTVPDGSFVQNEYLENQGFKRHQIPRENDPLYLTGLDPKYVYACFCKTGSRGETIGHVWLLVFVNGKWWSLESHGGKGPDMRRHDYSTLARICTDAYPIAKVG